MTAEKSGPESSQNPAWIVAKQMILARIKEQHQEIQALESELKIQREAVGTLRKKSKALQEENETLKRLAGPIEEQPLQHCLKLSVGPLPAASRSGVVLPKRIR